MDLHPGEEIVFEGHPSWRGVISFYIYGIGAAVLVGVVIGIAGATAIGSTVAVAGILLVVLVGFVKRMATHYVVTSQRLRIRRGILAKKIQQTRIDRVQNVNTDQRLVDRILRVGTVDFDTAGTDDSDFTFRGIANPDEVVAAVDRAQRLAADGGGAGDRDLAL
jgi:uncharacterized membrane protein YdbT with pleckstrin-like domain